MLQQQRLEIYRYICEIQMYIIPEISSITADNGLAHLCHDIIEPRHEISNNLVCAARNFRPNVVLDGKSHRPKVVCDQYCHIDEIVVHPGRYS